MKTFQVVNQTDSKTINNYQLGMGLHNTTQSLSVTFQNNFHGRKINQPVFNKPF